MDTNYSAILHALSLEFRRSSTYFCRMQLCRCIVKMQISFLFLQLLSLDCIKRFGPLNCSALVGNSSQTLLQPGIAALPPPHSAVDSATGGASRSVEVGAIVGGTLGGLILMLLLAVAVIFFYRRRWVQI